MSIQARPLSFGEQSFQDKGKKTKKEMVLLINYRYIYC